MSKLLIYTTALQYGIGVDLCHLPPQHTGAFGFSELVWLAACLIMELLDVCNSHAHLLSNPKVLQALGLKSFPKESLG